MTGDLHLLILELFGDFPRAGPGDFDPGLAKDGASRDDEQDVEDGVQRVEEGRGDAPRG